jgi:hypothetical protein
MLGRLRMSVDECIAECTSLADRVFIKKNSIISLTGKLQGRYDPGVLGKAVKEIILKNGRDEDELFWEQGKESCKA